MNYLLWTDTSPLPPALWRLLREMRRLGYSAISQGSIEKVVQAIAAKPLTVEELRQIGIYRDTILAAAWHGLAHFDLHREFGDKTLVSRDVNARQFSRFLKSTIKTHVWWSGLPPSYAALRSDGSKKSTITKESSDA
jgi:hypothetical protein